MKSKILLILTLFFFNLTFSQDIQKLEDNNGFRSIKLGSEINDYPNFIKKSKENIKFFIPWIEYDYILNLSNEDDFKKIGEAEIQQILVKVYNNKIYEIQIITDKDLEIIELLKIAYGEPNFDNIEADSLFWKTENGIECYVIGRASMMPKMNIRYTDLNLEKLAQKKEVEEKKKKALSEF